MSNRLAQETSPYLLQHAHNPVDWYPWGPEALEKARTEDRPILLSIGYSACHWCHVMERESFEDPAIADVMNRLYVNIKVDREERPDVDQIYMSAVQAMTGRGGWPMTMFLTPEGKPFYGGTYFPPTDRHGLPGFPRLLEQVADAYQNRREQVTNSSEALVAELASLAERPPAPDALAERTIEHAVRDLKRRYDPAWGGFGKAPKFPPSMNLELLLRWAHRTGDTEAGVIAEHTLQQMARGGMVDQLGGGFHRYSVDERWLVPHFEKMLYDNALLSHIYLLAHQATNNPFYQTVAVETLDYVAREMTSPEGGFYAAQDADSEGVEGKFFVWSLEEVLALLGEEDGRLFSAAFDVTEAGNFEGANILHLPRGLEEVAAECGVTRDRLIEAIVRGREVLFAAREKRIKPGRDEKVITSWNGLMLKSFAVAARLFEDDGYRAVAEKNARFLLTTLRQDGRLLRTYKDGQARIPGFLEDHANLADGLLALYEATLAPEWIEAALDLTATMIAEFWDPEAQVFFDAGTRHEALITRPRDMGDNATPSGNSVAVDVLLRLSHLTGDEAHHRIAVAALASVGDMMERFPTGMGRALCALDFHLAPVQEVVLVGDRTHEAMQALMRIPPERYRPYVVVAGGDPEAVSRLAGRLTALEGRTALRNQPTAHCLHLRALHLLATGPRARAPDPLARPEGRFSLKKSLQQTTIHISDQPGSLIRAHFRDLLRTVR
jgi:uncharacterized protein YyaL (SSP411 family)